MHLRPGQRRQLDGMADMGKFRRGGFEELAAGRRIKEQFGDFDAGTRNRGGIFNPDGFAVGQPQLRANRRALRQRQHSYLRDGGNARQRFPRKPMVRTAVNSASDRSLLVAWR